MPASPGRARRPSLRPLLFLDFEASPLSDGSWPIEIGYAWFADGRVQSRSVVIAPRPAWSMADWSDESARVHGMTLAQVRDGCPADAVAAETDVFAQFDVVSDNAPWEQRWLDRLREGRGPRIDVLSLRAAVRARLDDQAASAVTGALFRGQPAHRAGADAARLAQAWLGASRGYGIAA